MSSEGETRRAFLAGAAATGAAATLLTPARAGAAEVPCVPTGPGVRTGPIAATPDGRTIWTTDIAGRTICAHSRRALRRGTQIGVVGAPRDIAMAPDGRSALVTVAFWDRPALAVVDLHGREAHRLEVGPDPHSVAYAPGGRHAWVTGGAAHGTLTRVDPTTGRHAAAIAIGAHPHGVGVTRDGAHVIVALNGEHAVVVVDARTGKVVKRIATKPFPHRLAVAPRGDHAIVTHNGFGATKATPLDLHRGRAGKRVAVGLDPGGVAYSRSGRLALVTATGAGRATLLDGRTGHRKRSYRLGGAPGAVTAAGHTAVIADATSGALRTLRNGSFR